MLSVSKTDIKLNNAAGHARCNTETWTATVESRKIDICNADVCFRGRAPPCRLIRKITKTPVHKGKTHETKNPSRERKPPDTSQVYYCPIMSGKEIVNVGISWSRAPMLIHAKH
ncbi:hypothetical protein VTN49DRAFT_4151 [Thermomyces lanuginosus]|uniref:uncharacterized protein n=1 Tax=Thermomyces lanuginosus TaxID=5541 RepID=UPI003742D75D